MPVRVAIESETECGDPTDRKAGVGPGAMVSEGGRWPTNTGPAGEKAGGPEQMKMTAGPREGRQDPPAATGADREAETGPTRGRKGHTATLPGDGTWGHKSHPASGTPERVQARVAGLPCLQARLQLSIVRAFATATAPSERRESLPLPLSFVIWLERRVADPSAKPCSSVSC